MLNSGDSEKWQYHASYIPSNSKPPVFLFSSSTPLDKGDVEADPADLLLSFLNPHGSFLPMAVIGGIYIDYQKPLIVLYCYSSSSSPCHIYLTLLLVLHSYH
ncbi:hypothetical protein SLA2020_520110 [Shorea laevis]